MKIAPTPWTTAHDGHGGICLDDAKGRQIGFLSNRQDQDDHAALMRAAPALLEVVQALVQAREMGFSAADILDENSPIMDSARDALRMLEPVAVGAG